MFPVPPPPFNMFLCLCIMITKMYSEVSNKRYIIKSAFWNSVEKSPYNNSAKIWGKFMQNFIMKRNDLKVYISTKELKTWKNILVWNDDGKKEGQHYFTFTSHSASVLFKCRVAFLQFFYSLSTVNCTKSLYINQNI